jgi:hypothetical protein
MRGERDAGREMRDGRNNSQSSRRHMRVVFRTHGYHSIGGDAGQEDVKKLIEMRVRRNNPQALGEVWKIFRLTRISLLLLNSHDPR